MKGGARCGEGHGVCVVEDGGGERKKRGEQAIIEEPLKLEGKALRVDEQNAERICFRRKRKKKEDKCWTFI